MSNPEHIFVPLESPLDKQFHCVTIATKCLGGVSVIPIHCNWEPGASLTSAQETI